jgi:adenine-specific DNA-methyltransferase
LLSNLRGGDYHIYPEHLRNLPIPLVPKPIQQPVITLVDAIIAAKAAAPKIDTAALERQIDSLVYRLYNLTYEEINVIEPDFPLTRAEYEGKRVK